VRTSIYAKILSIAVGLILLMAVVAVASSFLAHRIGGALRVQSQVLIPVNEAIAGIEANILEQEVELERLLRLHTTADAPHTQTEETRARLEALHAKISQRFDAAYALVNAHEPARFDEDTAVEMARIAGLLQGIERAYGDYYGQGRTIVELIDQGHSDELMSLDRLLGNEEQEVDSALEELRTELKRFVEIGLQTNAQRESWLGILILSLTGGAILLGLPAAAIVTRGLVAPIKRLIRGVQAVRSGDLAFDVRVTSRDELGQLAEGFQAMVVGLRAKEQITETFGKYVDPRVVERLIEDPDLSNPGGDRRTMTVFFSDIADFTRLSTELTASSLLRLLNRYFEMMTVPIHDSGGVIDKYIGDAIMAYWGPPFVDAEVQAGAACTAALKQLAALAAFRAEVPEILGLRANLPKIDIRVGLATGPLVVGPVGSKVSRNYTVIGETVNLASRLEGVCKQYRVHIVVDEATRTAARGFLFRELDSIRVRGRAEPGRIFELRRLDTADGESDPLVGPFENALAAYRRRDFDTAATGFAQCLEIDPEDGASAIFLDRLAALRQAPPDDDWDGVWNLLK
jgi:class 3 adenylate cyclase